MTKKAQFTAVLTLLILVSAFFLYEHLRYKAQVTIVSTAKYVSSDYALILLDLHNPDWRFSASSFSICVYDDNMEFTCVQIQTPSYAKSNLEYSKRDRTYCGQINEEFIVNAMESKEVLIRVDFVPGSSAKFVKGHLRMTGATGDKLFYGQSSALLFSAKLEGMGAVYGNKSEDQISTEGNQ